MRAAQQKDVEFYYPILEGLLKDRKLPCEHGPARIALVDEFMLMSVSDVAACFKHRDTRNYVYVRSRFDRQKCVDIWALDVPNTGEMFQLGFFDTAMVWKDEAPCT